MSSYRVVPTEFVTEGETLRGNFVLPTDVGPFPGICKFHGLPGSSDQIHGFAAQLAAVGFAVLTFDFRGIRSSDGQFSLANELKDAKNAITHLLNSEYALKNWIGVYGASYGGAVAVLAAARDPRINAICLRAPVYDTLAFAQSPLIPPMVEWLVKEAPNEIRGLANSLIQKEILQAIVTDAQVLNPIREISKLAPRPLFIITGDADEGIDVEGVIRLFELAKEPKELEIIKGADHNLSNPLTYQKTVDAVVAWFQRICPYLGNK